MFGLGCFWCAERKFWELGEGNHVTRWANLRRPHASIRLTRSSAPAEPATTMSCWVYDPKNISY